jgi:hypothetical protein
VYRGKHVVVAPLHSRDGAIVAAIGIVDLLATIDLSCVFLEYTSVLEEVEGAKSETEEVIRVAGYKKNIVQNDKS